MLVLVPWARLPAGAFVITGAHAPLTLPHMSWHVRKRHSGAWFQSRDLWVMSPTR